MWYGVVSRATLAPPMPSKLHEALLLLFRNRPTLAAELLSGTLDVPLPAFTEARIELGDLTEVVPRELRADQVVVLYDGTVRVETWCYPA